jgi:hypothetical protein
MASVQPILYAHLYYSPCPYCCLLCQMQTPRGLTLYTCWKITLAPPPQHTEPLLSAHPWSSPAGQCPQIAICCTSAPYLPPCAQLLCNAPHPPPPTPPHPPRPPSPVHPPLDTTTYTQQLCQPTCCAVSPDTRGCRLINASVDSSSRVASLPALLITLRANPLGCSSRAFSKCSVSTICWLYSDAISGAATIACHALSVNSCCVMRLPPPLPDAAARAAKLRLGALRGGGLWCGG